MINNLSVGVWDKPQIIPFQELTTRYHFNSCVDAEQVGQIKCVLRDLDFSKHFNPENINYLDETIRRPVDYFPDEWKKNKTVRNAVLSNEKIPNLLIKVYCEKPGRGNPLASILRVPMAHFIQDAITKYALDDLVVPQKGLIPLFEDSVIEKLDENLVNQAFLVVVQKFSLLSKNQTLEKILELGDDKQENLARQVCTIPMKTGLGDYTWNNIKMTTENRIAIVDTEPLYGELFIDRFGVGYERSKKLSQLYTLKTCAKQGLTFLGESSLKNNLPIFHDITQKFLEGLD